MRSGVGGFGWGESEGEEEGGGRRRKGQGTSVDTGYGDKMKRRRGIKHGQGFAWTMGVKGILVYFVRDTKAVPEEQ